ncbi:MAG: reverse transcriptase family protein [Janthinobacterium lividum]
MKSAALGLWAAQERIDVLALQEPYSTRGEVRDLGSGVTVISNGTTADPPSAAIVVLRSGLPVLNLTQFGDSHTVVVEISYGRDSLYVVSMYCRFSLALEPFLQRIRLILSALRGKRIILCLDSNAKSALWGAATTDERGRDLEDLLSEVGLYVANHPDSPATFVSHSGSSHIDVTLTTHPREIEDWAVCVGEDDYDHRAITLSWGVHGSRGAVRDRTGRFVESRADWETFRARLGANLPSLDDAAGRAEVEYGVSAVSNALVEACRVSMPVSHGAGPKPVPWWTVEIEAARGDVRRARKRFQRTGDATAREALRTHYVKLKRDLGRLIRKEKVESWRKFVTRVGNDDPWGPVHRYYVKSDGPRRHCRNGALSALRLRDGSCTATTPQTLQFMIDSLMPSDTTVDEDDHHRELRALAASPCGHFVRSEVNAFTILDVNAAIQSMGKRKAPGLDRITAGILSQALPVLAPALTVLYNSCLRTSVFPSTWKVADVIAVPKGNDKDKSDPKSYRPISLLPVLGKTLEKLVSARLQDHLAKHCPLSVRQFGFMPKRSAEDAINALLTTVRDSTAKYVAVVFLDIRGAFDNAWWPSVLAALRRRDTPPDLYYLVKDFLSGRRAVLRHKSVVVEKEISKGCPQGSVLAPILWNLIFDDLLSAPMPIGVTVFGYADDGAVVVEAGSRPEIETRADLALATATEWGERNKLCFSAEKTEALLVRGPHARSPLIRMNGQRVKFVPQAKYLGVILDRKLNFAAHVNHVATKSKSLALKLRGLAATRWGLRAPALRLLYAGAVVPTAAYAASVWAHRMTQNVSLAAILNRAQRPTLLSIIGAYRTAPSNALQVLAKSLPLDLEVRRRSELYVRRRALADHQPTRTLVDIETSLVDEWQERWDTAVTGRVTHEFLPNIRWVLAQRWFSPSHFSAQFLTGHGAFQAYLHRFGISGVASCDCDESIAEDSWHVLLRCPLHAELRSQLTEALVASGVLGPWTAADTVTSPRSLGALETYAQAILLERERH